MAYRFQDIVLRVAPKRFESWDHFERETPEYSIGLEVVDDIPGHRGHHVHFDHHSGVVREATMSAAMQAYIAVRTEVEEAIGASGLNATILRPWYVLGPGHRWPYLLLPFYGLAGLFPPFRDGVQRLGVVNIHQMVNALLHSVENPAKGVRILGVPEIRTART